MSFSENYIEGLIKRGEHAAEEIDEVFKSTHPGGTIEAETIRELVMVIRGLQ